MCASAFVAAWVRFCPAIRPDPALAHSGPHQRRQRRLGFRERGRDHLVARRRDDGDLIVAALSQVGPQLPVVVQELVDVDDNHPIRPSPALFPAILEKIAFRLHERIRVGSPKGA